MFVAILSHLSLVLEQTKLNRGMAGERGAGDRLCTPEGSSSLSVGRGDESS